MAGPKTNQQEERVGSRKALVGVVGENKMSGTIVWSATKIIIGFSKILVKRRRLISGLSLFKEEKASK